MPTALIYQFDVFQYFYVILAAGVLSYSWRTIIALGNWTLALWMLGAAVMWWFGWTDPTVSAAAARMFPDTPALGAQLDPNLVHWDLRIQEVVVFFLVSVMLAMTVRRYQTLVLNSAEMARERTNLARYFSPTMVEELSTKDEPLGQIRSHDAAGSVCGYRRVHRLCRWPSGPRGHRNPARLPRPDGKRSVRPWRHARQVFGRWFDGNLRHAHAACG